MSRVSAKAILKSLRQRPDRPFHRGLFAFDFSGKEAEGKCKTAVEKIRLPPDKQKLATENILKQAELLFRDTGFSAVALTV